MCGLVGLAGVTGKAKEIITFMLILDSTRGVDGTGLFFTDFKDEEILKSVGDCYNLISNKKYSSVTSGYNLYIGHNRASTSGKNSSSNAHPFDVGDIVGAHNGTLRGYYRKDFEVDSEYLLDKISKEGAKKAIEEENGAWALVWYNKKEKTLNFLRNSERPLFYFFDEDKNLYWASEKWMLEAVKEKFSLKTGKIFSLNEDTQYVYSFNKLNRPVIKEVINNIKQKAVTPPATNLKSYNGTTSVYTSYNTNYKKGGLVCSDCGESKTADEMAYMYNYIDKVTGRQITSYICKECEAYYNKTYNMR